MAKPTFEEWKKTVTIGGSPNWKEVDTLINAGRAHGLDLADRFDDELRKIYENEIEGDDEMT